MHLVEITTTACRNLAPGTVRWGPLTNLVVGGNGEGKTNLLEAVAVLGNLRSFRASSLRQMVSHGATEFLLEGRVVTRTGAVRLRHHVVPGPPLQRSLEVAGVAATVPQYLQVLPVIALTGSDRDLVAGAPGVRRAFLDRLAFLLEPQYFDELRRFRHTLRQRNAALASAVGDREMEVWEERLAHAAAVVVDRRRRAASRLATAFEPVYGELRQTTFPDITISYRGETTIDAAGSVVEVEEKYRKRYNETRVRDRNSGVTGEGPQRHDMDLRANGKAVRHVLSSGQTKLVAAALRLASLKQIEEQREEPLPVIIDDIDAELDPRALSRLISHLEGERQLFLSTAAGGEMRGLPATTSRLTIERGTVIGQAGECTDE